MTEFTINGRHVGEGFPPYIIAEMSGNHNKDFEQALAILDAAVRVGASAIKLQAYTPDSITLNSRNSDFKIDNPESLWFNRYLYDLYEDAHTPWELIEFIYVEARKRNIDCFSSVFDETSVELLEDLDTPVYKIASFENNHLPLIKKVASTKKPLIISTGASSEEDIQETVEIAREAGCVDLALLKCTSDYPAQISDLNLTCIPYLKKYFNCVIGLSDHTLGIGAAVAGVALGASIIEKHFTTSRAIKSVDSGFSADENEFGLLIKECSNAWSSIGKLTFSLSDKEKDSAMFKRSIYSCRSIKKGEIISTENIKIVRPGFGLHPRFYNRLLGKTSPKDLGFGERLDHTFLLD